MTLVDPALFIHVTSRPCVLHMLFRTNLQQLAGPTSHAARARSIRCYNITNNRGTRIISAAAGVDNGPGEATAAKAPAAASPAGRVLFVGGLPGTVDAEVLQKQMKAACAHCSEQPTHIEVADFDHEAQRSRFSAGWKHKGHALLAFTSDSALAAAAAAISSIEGWGAAATLGPARKVPKHWPPELTLTSQEIAAKQQQQAAAELRRAHNRRQRQRQQQRLIDSVEQLVSGLPQPAGQYVVQQYQPLLGQHFGQLYSQQHDQQYSWQYNQQYNQQYSQQYSQHVQCRGQVAGDTDDRETAAAAAAAATAIDHLLSLMPERLAAVIRPDRLHQLAWQQQQQQPPGLIRLAAAPCVADVERQLLFDWSKMPAVVDPAFGGQLADADVVRAGAGRMNLRALRKRVQLESFALLLLQLTLPALTTQPPHQLHIVEFGCGSGNLVLPLAHLFPSYTFTAVDMKRSAVQLLQQRVEQGDIANVQVLEGTIEQYAGTADVVLALHACGAASDWSLKQAARCNAAYIVSPCCIGKINKNNSAGLLYSNSSSNGSSSSSKEGEESVRRAAEQAGLLQYPRSQWLTEHMGMIAAQVIQQQQQIQRSGQQQEQQQQQLIQGHGQPIQLDGPEEQQQQVGASASGHYPNAEQQQQGSQPVLNRLQQAVLQSGSPADQCRGLFSLLAQAADYSHTEDHGYPDLAALAKSNVEFDRGLSMVEVGYRSALVRLLQPELTAKSDVLIGVPAAAAAAAAAAVDDDSSSNSFGTGDDDSKAVGLLQQPSIGKFSWAWE